MLKPLTGKERNSTLKPLKPIPSSSFKNQKSKESSKHRDKAKSIMLVTDLNSSQHGLNSSQGKFEHYMLKDKPPDLEVTDLANEFVGEHMGLEAKSKSACETIGENRDLPMEGHEDDAF